MRFAKDLPVRRLDGGVVFLAESASEWKEL
jgi:hypothetical protein